MADSEPPKILFVDDEENILDIAKEYFEQKGYPVLTAQNGIEAMRILGQEKIDCCFTDINMPEMDGIELAEQIRLSDSTIPVIVMTGYPSLDSTIKTIRNGVVDFLIKPVSLNQMELCLQRVFRERELFVENVLLKKELESKARLEELNQELQYKVEGLRILEKILSDLSTVNSNEDVFRKLVDMANDICGADESQFSIINDADQKPIIVAHAATARAGNGGGASETEAASGAAVGDELDSDMERLVLEIATDQIPLLISQNNGKQLPENIHSSLIVPIKIREKTFGVLTTAITTDRKQFSKKDLYYLSFLTRNASHSIENMALYENIYENLFSTLYAFVRAIELRDPYTQQHSSRVTDVSLLLGRELNCSSEELDTLKFAGPLHDIGKIGIPDKILLKPGKLTSSEYEKIKEHPNLGADIIGRLGMWGQEQEIIRCHHEWFDGSGYPNGLKQDAIPMLARILSVADAFDAMASDRAYRNRMDMSKIIDIIRDATGTQFDPKVSEAFFKLVRDGEIRPEA
ncbi:MAG: response regulator [Deltaproteobacteria bacterium]|nr:response regulator [Deltaproteobacteria bacterium]